ncbi:MAG: hypothetical protein H0V70_30335 [Ktedonobacteraceae bacterium]|jgi:hypothetical protein|nr:hypothetical protein [Ktedonobacteraceae bacterium]
MTNMETSVEGNILTIKVDLTKEYGLTSSQKSIKVASSDGNISVPGREDIKLGLNIYKPTNTK